jgi:hypothetical protein
LVAVGNDPAATINANRPVDGHCMAIEDLDEDWRDWWEERAAILEYEAGLPREQAEADALAETIRQMELRAQQGRS